MSSKASSTSKDKDNTIIVSWLLSLAPSSPLSDKNELLTSEPEQQMVKGNGKRGIEESPEEHSSKKLRITETSQTILPVAEKVCDYNEVRRRMIRLVMRLKGDIEIGGGTIREILLARDVEDLLAEIHGL
jgi:hypothetical protein